MGKNEREISENGFRILASSTPEKGSQGNQCDKTRVTRVCESKNLDYQSRLTYKPSTACNTRTPTTPGTRFLAISLGTKASHFFLRGTAALRRAVAFGAIRATFATSIHEEARMKRSVCLVIGTLLVISLHIGTGQSALALEQQPAQAGEHNPISPNTSAFQASCPATIREQDIPDDGSWLQVCLMDPHAPDQSTVTEVRIKYELEHPDPSQLEIRLTRSGTNASATLWNRGRGGRCRPCTRPRWQRRRWESILLHINRGYSSFRLLWPDWPVRCSPTRKGAFRLRISGWPSP